MCIRLPDFVFALPDLWWRQKSLKILFSILLVDPGDRVNQGLSANQNLGSLITRRLRERTDDMDLISHGSWLFDLIDQSGPLPFLDPVSCVVTELRGKVFQFHTNCKRLVLGKLSKLYILCFLPHHSLHILQTTTFCGCLDRCQFWKSVNHGGWQNEANDGHKTRYLIFCLIHGQGLRPLPSLHLFIPALGLVSILPQRTLGFSKWRQRLSLEVATF